MAMIEDRIAPLTVALAVLDDSLRNTAVTGSDHAANATYCRELQRAVVRLGAQSGAGGASGLAHAAEIGRAHV